MNRTSLSRAALARHADLNKRFAFLEQLHSH
jgi:hypothetical protein